MRLLALAVALLMSAQVLAAGPAIVVRGLFKNAVLLEVDGEQRFIKVGDTDGHGITLLSADSKQAIVEIDGQREVLTLNARVGGRYSAPVAHSVTLHRNLRKEYRAAVQINGRSMEAIVDTGANLVALSGRHAEALGLDYKAGRPTVVATASGHVKGFLLSLDKLAMAGIIRHHVPAVVVEGSFPKDVLLGMSFLEQLNMREEENILTLSPRY